MHKKTEEKQREKPHLQRTDQSEAIRMDQREREPAGNLHGTSACGTGQGWGLQVAKVLQGSCVSPDMGAEGRGRNAFLKLTLRPLPAAEELQRRCLAAHPGLKALLLCKVASKCREIHPMDALRAHSPPMARCHSEGFLIKAAGSPKIEGTHGPGCKTQQNEGAAMLADWGCALPQSLPYYLLWQVRG